MPEKTNPNLTEEVLKEIELWFRKNKPVHYLKVAEKAISITQKKTAEQIFKEIHKIEAEECVNLTQMNNPISRRFKELKKRWLK